MQNANPCKRAGWPFYILPAATMATSVGDVETALRAGLTDVVHVQVDDTSGGCGASFMVIVVAKQFEGVPLLQRQRLVHAALGADLMKGIHALEIKAWTNAQWEANKAKAGS